MNRKFIQLLLIMIFSSNQLFAQIFSNNGANVSATPGAFIQVNGAAQNAAGGIITVQESAGISAEMIITGNFTNDATAGGNGIYRVAGNWLNNNTFNAGTGSVFLNGAAQQIGGSVSTTFFNLILQGTGNKTQTINQTVGGVLNLNDRELLTDQFTMFVTNPNVNAIQRTTGFVSSTATGVLSRNTNTTLTYLFPVGSSVGITRYRPVDIAPVISAASTYTVRMANTDATLEGFSRSLIPPAICNTNSLFYHRINRTAGTSAINLSIYYDPATDGSWVGLANWTTTPLWQIVTGSATSPSTPPFSVATVNNWSTFTQTPYILYVSIPVVSVSPPSATICAGSSTAMTVSGATNYSWSHGLGTSATQNVSPASTTTYTVTGTSAGCTGSTSVTISVNPNPVISVSPSSATICVGNSTTITALGATTYSWSHGLGTSASQNVNPVSTTTYTVTGTGANGCTSTTSVTVTVNPNPIVSVSPSSATICVGGSTSITALGAATYIWSHGLGTSAFQSVNPSMTTTYTVTGTSAGCTGTTSVTVTVNPNPVVTVSPSSATICVGGSTALTAIGATSYNWSHGLGTSASQNVTPASTTTYTVTGTSVGCTGTTTVTVTVNPNPVVTVSPLSATICAGGSTTISASGATSFNWSHGLGTSASQNVTPVSTTTYTVTGTSVGCAGTTSVTVTVNPNPVVTVSPLSATICAGGSTTISASGATSFNWSHGLGTSASQNVTPVSTTTYTVTGTSVGCTGTTNVTVTVNPLPTLNLGPPSIALCAGDNINLDAGPGFTYNWSTMQTSQIINVNTAGLYSVTVTDGNSCQNTDEVTIVIQLSYDATITSGTNYCINGGNVTFTAVDAGGVWSGNGINVSGLFDPIVAGTGTHIITYGISGSCGDTATANIIVHPAPIVNLGSNFNLCIGDSAILNAGPGFTYNWSTTQTSQTISVNTGGTFSVTVTDGNNCQDTSQITITLINLQDATILTSGPFCSNVSPVQFIGQDPGGLWSGSGISAGGMFDPAIAGSGTHIITYGISGSCGDTATANITVNAAPIVNLGSNFNLCIGDSAILDAGPGFSYNWSTAQTSQTISVNTGGIYSVTVTDGNNCQDSSQITITLINLQDATILTSGPFCSNVSPIQFTAQDPGGVWSGSGISAGGMFDPAIAGSGTHIITYGIPGSCGDTATANITVNAAPIVDLGAPQTVCIGDTVTLDAGPGISYNWLPSGSSQTQYVTTSGVYSVTVTDNNGCQGSDDVTITFIAQQDASILTDGPFCSNSGVQQFISQDGGGIWSGSGMNATGEFNPTYAGIGNHTITYTIAGNCGDTVSKVITVNEAPAVTFTHTDESCIGANDGTIILSVNGGLPPYIISWYDGSEEMNLDSLLPGVYSVTVADQNGCVSADSVRILEGLEDCYLHHVYVPNIFSPNGDGENDVLLVRGEGIQYLEFMVFNRWGEKVFETTTKEKGWDGTYQGEMSDPGVFVYYIKVTYTNLSIFENNGNITLVE